MLVNLSIDQEVLANLAEDDVFLETLFNKMMVNMPGSLPMKLSIILISIIIIRISRSRTPMKSQCY